MSNRIEKFIEQKRHLMDSENVPEAVWQKIKLPVAEKTQTKVAVWKPIYKWVAAASITALVALTSYLLIQKYSHDISPSFAEYYPHIDRTPWDLSQTLVNMYLQ